MTDEKWVVHKFGGTSVANAERYRNVAKILEVEPGARKGVVVSAMSGVTDSLIGLMDLARAKNDQCFAKLDELRARHERAAEELLPAAESERMKAVFAADAKDLANVLRAVFLARTYSEQLLELVAGYGEIWSAQMLGAYLAAQGKSVRWLDARDVLVVVPGEIGPIVQWQVSRLKLDAWLAANPSQWLVITGYVAATPDGAPTTLKRNGSDFSGSIFGALLDASSITIWTDVDGVLSADPRRVPEAIVLDRMSYDEAMELAYFGAKVLHPRTMAPAVEQAIPIWIRNTFNATHPGTVIHTALPPDDASAKDPARAVKGFSTVDGVALINVEGTGLVGVPGIARRIFGALREVDVSVVMISQASSEHSICFAVPERQSVVARETVERAFATDLQQGAVQQVQVVGACSILAAVGDGMAQLPGVAAKFFGALGKAGVNIRAIAQGSSERNISAVIDRKDSTRALRAVHAGFYLSDQTLSVGLVGPGLVGSELLNQLKAQAPVLKAQFKIDLHVRGIADSQRMLLSDGPIALEGWAARLEKEGKPVDLAAFAAHVRSEHLPHAVIVDCSASDDVAGAYPAWLERGVHVVTPNKRAGAGPLPRYERIRKLGRELRTHFLYEATVGAGLPVITTLRDLVQTGDRIVKIEGVLSGTLAYVFNSYDGQQPFSAVVAEAKRRGYTEPDPRDDLSGMDVARKLVILAREAGRSLELSDVQVESLVPGECAGCADPEEFLRCLERSDAAMARLHAEAREKGEVLRYVGVLDEQGRASVSLRRYGAAHPFARITGSDNILAFTTSRYLKQPLVVQGPGAGPEVTAGGVFADLLRLAAYVGAAT